MTAKHDSGQFSNSPFRFSRDEDGQLLKIPTSTDLQSYLALDQDTGEHVQVRILPPDNPDKFNLLKRIWSEANFSQPDDIHEMILAHGEENGSIFYVSLLPDGQPVSQFIKSKGPIPPEIAAELILDFLAKIRTDDPVSIQENVISPESLWITSKKGNPMLLLGDLSPTPSENAEAANSNLFLDLFTYLTGNPPFDESFQNTCASISEGEPTINSLVEKLTEYGKESPSPDGFWNSDSHPSPIIDQLLTPASALDALSNLDRKGEKTEEVSTPNTHTETEENPQQSVEIDTNKRSRFKLPSFAKFLPLLLIAIAGVGVFSVGGYLKDKFASKTNQKDLDSMTPTAYQKPLLPNGPMADKMEPTSIEEETAHLATTNTDPPVSTGDQSSLPFPNQDISYQPEEIDITAEQTKSIDQFVVRAADARKNGQLFAAMENEVAFLEQVPQSVDSKLRLDKDLLSIQENSQNLGGSQLSQIEKAAKFNTRAYEILIQHYRKNGMYEEEIATLLRYYRTGRADKLSEAGERILASPTSTITEKAKARQYFIDAAKEGDRNGQFLAGESLVLGRGGPKDTTQGSFYLKKAVDNGDPRAMDLLGICYVRAWGVPRNDTRAVELFQAAIENGSIPAYYNLGARYAQGQGVPRNAKLAADIFEEGSKKGNANCMVVLGRSFEAGFGRDEDREQAIFWIKKAALQGHPEAITWCQKNGISLHN